MTLTAISTTIPMSSDDIDDINNIISFKISEIDIDQHAHVSAIFKNLTKFVSTAAMLPTDVSLLLDFNYNVYTTLSKYVKVVPVTELVGKVGNDIIEINSIKLNTRLYSRDISINDSICVAREIADYMSAQKLSTVYLYYVGVCIFSDVTTDDSGIIYARIATK